MDGHLKRVSRKNTTRAKAFFEDDPGPGLPGFGGGLKSGGDGAMIMPMMAKKIFYKGKVQGVGFRFGVRQIAEGFSVAGYASNLPDGRVEVFLQGDREEVEAMEKEIGQSHLAGFIREVSGGETEAVSGCKGFHIQ